MTENVPQRSEIETWTEQAETNGEFESVRGGPLYRWSLRVPRRLLWHFPFPLIAIRVSRAKLCHRFPSSEGLGGLNVALMGPPIYSIHPYSKRMIADSNLPSGIAASLLASYQ